MDILKKSPITTFFILILLSLNYSCSDYASGGAIPLPEFIYVGDATRSYTNVDERLWVYFERFEDAGIERGINVDLAAAEVTGSIEVDPGHNSPGACTTDSAETLHHVSIRESFWETASPTYREIIVFHELGHCFLDRGHLNAVSSDGICLSLMRAGGTDCVDNYFENTRNEYLDELFGL